MSVETSKAAEARGYSKGYAAGKRRLDADMEREEARGRREAFRQQAFLVVLPALLASGTWGRKVKGEHVNWKTMAEYCAGAWQFVDEAEKGASFL